MNDWEEETLTANTGDLVYLIELERALANDAPFADWRDIVNRAMTFVHRGVEAVAERLPVAQALLAALDSANDERRYRVLGDPVVRDAINESLARVKAPSLEPPAVGEEIFEAAISALSEGETAAPLEAAATRRFRIGKEPYHSWVWWDERSDDALGKRFRALFQREIAHSISSKPAVLRTPDERLQETLQSGSRLLGVLLPDLARSVLMHVHLVAVVDVCDRRKWGREFRTDLCQNVSTHAIPGTIFLSPSPLRSPWHAAEALLHEAAHKKLSDLVLTRPIFRPGFAAATARTIRAAWNSPHSWNPNDWSIDRALFAFHVYVHLGLFFRIVQIRANDLQGEYGPLRGMEPTHAGRAAFDRARYLSNQLQRTAVDDLGPDGHRLVIWLSGVLDALDPSPPLADPAMHLWLDRYDRETKEIGHLIARIVDAPDNGSQEIDAPYEQWSVHRIVDHLIQSEVVAAYRVLSILGEAEPPSLPFYDGDRWSVAATSHASFEELAAAFQGMRTFVSRTLRGAPPETFQKTCMTRRAKTLKDIVEDMIDHAYRHVGTLVERLRARKRGRTCEAMHLTGPS